MQGVFREPTTCPFGQRLWIPWELRGCLSGGHTPSCQRSEPQLQAKPSASMASLSQSTLSSQGVLSTCFHLSRSCSGPGECPSSCQPASVSGFHPCCYLKTSFVFVIHSSHTGDLSDDSCHSHFPFSLPFLFPPSNLPPHPYKACLCVSYHSSFVLVFIYLHFMFPILEESYAIYFLCLSHFI